MCCKKAFVLFSERAHTRDLTRVATRVHLTIIERTHGVTECDFIVCGGGGGGSSYLTILPARSYREIASHVKSLLKSNH